jgi:tRNA-2-methylthio-N6-dimethylallyladenosine synthase
MKPLNVYIETYGCQMNKLDSEYVTALLDAGGFRVVSGYNEADVILLNTCGVRHNAEQRIHGRIGELSSLKRGKPDLLFGVIGCMAQRLGEKLLSGVVRIVAGPDSYRNLPDMIERALSEPVVDTVLETGETYEGIMPFRSGNRSAWVAVMRGCDNYCSYCVVPYTRGRERSIPHGRIIDEVVHLKENGFREVTLLGQNVNSYHDGNVDFAGLLECVADTGIGWIRFLTSHPKDLTAGILEVMARRENVCNHLHLPLQSGSDRILRAMNRKYTVSRYLSLIELARSIVSGINISTDLIFGFPGETGEDFQKTLEVMRTVRFDFAFMYRYSEREGTQASLLPGKIPEDVRIERLKEAIALQNSIMRQKNREHINSVFVVLVKGKSKDQKGWYGFTETNIPVVFTSGNNSVEIGTFVKIRVEKTTGASLVGTIA